MLSVNISAGECLPGRDIIWPLANAPWSDRFAFLSPVDHYGKRGRNGFGLADMCGGVWEFTLDHFDPTGGHEAMHFLDKAKQSVSRPVCRGGNYFDVPGNARCAVRLGRHPLRLWDRRVVRGVPRDAGARRRRGRRGAGQDADAARAAAAQPRAGFAASSTVSS